MAAIQGHTQDVVPKHAIGVHLGTSFYPQAQVVDAGGTGHARFPLGSGIGGALSYRHRLDPQWYITGTARAEYLGYSLHWSGNMEPLGHWAFADQRPVGLPPEEFYFMALRGDIGRVIVSKGRVSLRSEVGMELVVLPTSYRGYAQSATVNGLQVENALVITSVINENSSPFSRVRLALGGAYTDKRSNEWTLSFAGQFALQQQQLRGAYALHVPGGVESGTFSATLNAFEVVVARYFSWGRPKLPRWAS